ncbi:MAG: TetM/TetW/TetO/TetS family tetracycline resistance ribosomal protection protein, partial [Oscillospiraceae bacterium]|nr:TetM/TetW/TetO/TetS family tetracycline resistance ribosomal protection protein [Oscillospiraceae bacterium]
MKKLVIGILAHVDAGKTTLSEGLLYTTGNIRKLGRVDHRDTFLDTHELERERGITIFSKQATFSTGDMELTLMDTPGHVDFSAEMERTLQILDYAILVISGTDGVQARTETLWRMLKLYRVPTFIFVTKMDLAQESRENIMADIRARLGESCVDFNGGALTDEIYEEMALLDEKLLERFLDSGSVSDGDIAGLVKNGRLSPCYFGSGLKLDGVEGFLDGLYRYTVQPVYSDRFAARVYKIARDIQGNRLTFMKLTGGSLKVRDTLSWQSGDGELKEEKITQIRIYSGAKFNVLEKAEAGCVCAVLGPDGTWPGQGLGEERDSEDMITEPVLNYRIALPPDCDPRAILPKLLQLQEEDPQLHIAWDDRLREIHAGLMGDVQTEVIKRLVKERFDVDVNVDSGRIMYRETIAGPVVGVGHFEPLRHYAEVHLLMEPLERGSGLVFGSDCSEDVLDRNWQRLILTHLEEKQHLGVLTGSPISDMRITLIAGRAHLKHTEGGDFRQATYRAVRQGLMKAESVLLEPYYEFRLEVPGDQAGQAIND